MKACFTFNGHSYISPSKKEARRFLGHWGSLKGELSGSDVRIGRLVTGWKIKHVERGPGYMLRAIEFPGIEY